MKTIIAAASLFGVSVAQAAEQTVISESNRWGVVVLGALFVLAAGSAAIKLFLRPYRMKVFQKYQDKARLAGCDKGFADRVFSRAAIGDALDDIVMSWGPGRFRQFYDEAHAEQCAANATMDIEKAKLKALAEATKGWDYMTACWPEEVEFGDEATGNWCVGPVSEDDDKSPVLIVNTAQWDAEEDAQKLAEYYAAANAPTILAMLAEIDKLKTENAVLRQGS